MPIYRAFEIDDAGHLSTTPTMIEARSDVHAIVKSVQLVNGTQRARRDRSSIPAV